MTVFYIFTFFYCRERARRASRDLKREKNDTSGGGRVSQVYFLARCLLCGVNEGLESENNSSLFETSQTSDLTPGSDLPDLPDLPDFQSSRTFLLGSIYKFLIETYLLTLGLA